MCGLAAEGPAQLRRLPLDVGDLRGGAAAVLAGEVMAETDVILTPDQRVRVFVSSTLEELAAGLLSAGRPRR